MSPTVYMTTPRHTCNRCGNSWMGRPSTLHPRNRAGGKPDRCPWCGSRHWDEARQRNIKPAKRAERIQTPF